MATNRKAVSARMTDLFDDQMLMDSGDLIAGVDEAGRGPLAGAVYAAAVILDPNEPIEGLRDSKKLTEKERERLAVEIKEKAIAWSVADATVEEIEEMNILKATMLAMRRAVLGLAVDGNRLPELPYPANAIVKGDDKIAAISAASIIAKTTRDHRMMELEELYPGYGFAKHKGYGVEAHIAAIKKLGVCPEHRKTFEPIATMLGISKKKKAPDFELKAD